MERENTFNAKKLHKMGVEFETFELANEFSDFIEEELEVRIGERISKGLSSEVLDEFDRIPAGDAIQSQR